MKFKKLKAKNVYSFKDLVFDFNHNGTTLILGKNLDQGTANGAGKSSILKTLYFALWGKELNGESVDLIKTRGEKDGFIVELEFEDRGHDYSIVRYRDRKDKELKTGVEFYIDGKPFNGETATDTQKIIERKLKISPRLFLSSILTAQNETKHFLTVNDTEKKELFSELLDLTAYSKAYDIVKEEISQKEKSFAELESKIDTILDKIKEKKQEIADFEKNEDTFEENRLIELKKLESDLIVFEKKLISFSETKEKLESLESSLEEKSKSAETLKKKLIENNSTLKDESAISDLLFEYRNEKQKYENQLERIKNQKEDLDSIIKEIESSSSEKEKESKEFVSVLDSIVRGSNSDYVTSVLLRIREFFFLNLKEKADKINSNKEKILTLLEKEKEVFDLIKQKDISCEKLKAKLESFKKIKQEKSDIESELLAVSSEIDTAVRSISLIKSSLLEKRVIEDKISEITLKIKEVKEKDSPYRKLVSASKDRLESLNENLALSNKNKLKLEEESLYLSFWKSAFSPVGIRSFIFDEVLDLLNRKVQSNLNDLFEGALSVIFESESKNQKGSISNKINTKIYLSGKETTFGMLSGGEQQRAILAVNLALSEVAESYSGSVMNIKFLDEPFNGIDSSGQMQCFRLFARLAQSKEGLYVISHDESFQQLCPNSVYIIKKNGISAISDRDSFDNISNN